MLLGLKAQVDLLPCGCGCGWEVSGFLRLGLKVREVPGTATEPDHGETQAEEKADHSEYEEWSCKRTRSRDVDWRVSSSCECTQ